MTTTVSSHRKAIFFSLTFYAYFFLLFTIITTLKTIMFKKRNIFMVDSCHLNTPVITTKIDELIIIMTLPGNNFIIQ